MLSTLKKNCLSPWAIASLLALGLGLGLAGSSAASAELPSPQAREATPADGAKISLEELPSSDPLRFEAECNPDPCGQGACAPEQCTSCDNVDRCAENACDPGGEELCGGGGGPGFDPHG